ncbi:MAG: hypothetical protein LDL33_05390 [Desulfomonile sp.]|nr:hypothetical protein [Desulfomonile sp.]
MLAYIKSSSDNGKTRRKYYCAHCGAFITESGALLTVNHSTEHSYVNPAGVRCHFMTFVHCDNVVVDHELYVEHSWFPGYGWRFLICKICYQHLGWKYDAVTDAVEPEGFFGVLLGSVRASEDEE